MINALRCLLISVILTTATALAAPAYAETAGELDLSFGTGGAAFLTSDAVEGVLAVDQSGRTVVATYTAAGGSVTRFLTTGARDLGFGGNGYVGLGSDHASALTVLHNGSIAVGLRSGGVLKLTSSGGVNAAFGNGGVVQGLGSYPITMLERPVTSELVVITPTDVFQISPAGALDLGFGTQGAVHIEAEFKTPNWYLYGKPFLDIASSGRPQAAALAADGSLFMIMSQNVASGVIRLSPTGTAVLSYGENGIFRIAARTVVGQLLALPDGRLIVNEQTEGNLGMFAVAGNAANVIALADDGIRDTTFGDAGKVTIGDLPSSTAVPLGMYADSVGRLVLYTLFNRPDIISSATSYSMSQGESMLDITRLNVSDGSHDLTFKGTGFEQFVGMVAMFRSVEQAGRITALGAFIDPYPAPPRTVLVRLCTSDPTCPGADPTALFGGPGNDTLTGTYANDNENGFGGNDSLTGGAGRDSQVGAAGNDKISGG
ncbi:MAG: hypothetical protein H7123_08555, partial [Thermoleophilia bacterium]|nr:hypothetical protein [Thermoleophilia bacterium]